VSQTVHRVKASVAGGTLKYSLGKPPAPRIPLYGEIVLTAL
jgi:hypothetical protein